MAHEIALRVAVPYRAAGHQANHFVATPVAVVVVEGLEVVEVTVASDELATAGQQPLDVLGDRNVSRQEGQRVRMAGCFDARFGDGAHQLIPGAQPDIAAVVRDDESFGQVSLVLGGEDAHQFFNVMLLLDEAGRQVCKRHAGFSAIEFLEIPLCIPLHELATVDQPDRHCGIADGHGVQRGVRIEKRCQVVVSGLRTDGGCIDQPDVSEPARRRRGAQGRHDGDPLVVQHLGGFCLDGNARHRYRPPDEIALPEVNAQVTHGAQIIGGLDALCDQRGPEHLGNLHEGAQGLQLLGMLADLQGEILVDLHHLGLQFGPQPKA